MIAERIYFIGIGGVSLSSLAKFLTINGVSVSGSDRSLSDALLSLSELGCDVHVGSLPEKIGSPDLTVYSGAIPEDDPELSYCRAHGIPCMERDEFLGKISEGFSCCLAVSGTHGKTTVTSMLVKCFASAGKRLYGHIGGDSVEFGNCFYSGNDFFITEACEYRRSFLKLKPRMGIVLNVESDHPDTYGSLSEVYDAFAAFCKNTRDNSGLVLVNGDCAFYRERLASSDAITFGLSDRNRFRATDIYEYKKGYKGFLIRDFGNPVALIRLPIPGEHNVLDALCAFAASVLSGIPADIAASALNSFGGVKRRFEYVCRYRGSDVYTDYAHHPSELRATLDTAFAIGSKPTVVFQPHTYSRTAALFDEFVSCLEGVDRIIILKEYAAREKPSDGRSARELFLALRNREKYYCENIMDVLAVLNERLTPSESVLILGAGDIINLCDIMRPPI